MRVAQMFRQIDDAVAEEAKTGQLRAILVEVARVNGLRPTKKDLDETMQFIADYVRNVPLVLMTMFGAADRGGAASDVEPVLEACENYWFAGLDFIPDHHGLLGLTDDAYYVHCIMQGFGERRGPGGKPLLELPFRSLNQTMRNLIGEPHATVLDLAVAEALHTPSFETALASMPNMGRLMVDRHPIWGTASVDDIVKVQMGALGIV